MRPRLLLGLLATVAGLLAFIGFYEKDLPSSAERAELENKIFKAPRDQISSVKIEKGEQVVVLASTTLESADPKQSVSERRWRVVEPIDARADSDLIDGLLKALGALEKKRTLEAISPGEAGFDPPRARVSVTQNDQLIELLVGKEIPASTSMLLQRVDSGEISVVGNRIWAELERPAGDWRARDMVEAGANEISRVILDRQADEIVLRRNGDDFWIELPVEDLAGEDQVGDLLADIAGLRADPFIDDPIVSLAEMGLDPPTGIIEVEADGLEPIRIEIGSLIPDAESRRFARVGDQLFETSSDLATSLERSVSDWRSLDLTSLQTFQIDRLEADDDRHGRLTLVRSGAEWKRNDDEISFTSVSDLLYVLVDAGALGFEEKESVGELQASDRLLSVSLFGKRSEESFSFFSGVEDDSVRATVNGREIVFTISRETFADIEEKFAAVRSAESRYDEGLVIDAGSKTDESPIEN